MLRFFRRLWPYRSSIHFIYAERWRYYATTVMRGQQLSEIAQKALGQRVYFTSSDYQFKDCVIVLTKWAMMSLSLKDLERLKKKHNRLIFDPVDGLIPADKLKYADIIIVASNTAY